MSRTIAAARQSVARLVDVPMSRSRSLLRPWRSFPARTLHDLEPVNRRWAPNFALTFDDGPDPDWTLPLLEVLERHDAKATFFVCGASVERWPDILRRIVAGGHSVGNHGFSHRPLVGLSRPEVEAEIDITTRLIQETCGMNVRLMRPPYGAHDSVLRTTLAARSLTPVLWTSHGHDWALPDLPRGVTRATTVEATGMILRRAQRRGLQPVALRTRSVAPDAPGSPEVLP